MIAPNPNAERAAATAYRVREALAAHDRGWKVFPTVSKKPVKGSHGPNDPPHPRAAVERFARVGREVAFATGEIVVVDSDPRHGGDLGPLGLPATVVAITGGAQPGEHHYFLCPPGVKIGNSAGKLGSGIDVRGRGGYVLLPGSIHPETGRQYRWAAGHSPDDLALAPLPAHLASKLQAPNAKRAADGVAGEGPEGRARASSKRGGGYGAAALDRECATVSAAHEGTRNHTLAAAAFSLGQLVGGGVLDRATVEARLRSAFAGWGEDAKSEDTMRRQLDAGAAQPRVGPTANDKPAPEPGAQTRVFLSTEGGNAERVREWSGSDLRYCHDWRKWFVWDGRRFAIDRTGAAARSVKVAVRRMLTDALRIEDDTMRQVAAKWALSSDSAAKRRATLELASVEPGIPILPTALDRGPFLFNVENGTLDLERGVLRPHDRADLLTKLSPVHYRPDALAPRWRAFLEEVLPDAGVRAFVQRAFFWSLTGDVSEHALFFCYGEGNNGKSTFLRVLLDIAGEYGKQMADELLLAKTGESHPTEKADLFGMRAAVTTELPAGRAFNEALVKRLTGADEVSARRMREDFWTFTPTHHLWLAGNDKPNIRGRDLGIWRRVHLIPFTVVVKAPDPELPAKLRSEREGILAWAVEGGTPWRERGLDPPAAVRAATDAYRGETDALEPFFDELCVFDPAASVRASVLHEAYAKWCARGGERAMGRSAFGRALTERGIDSRKLHGTMMRFGLRLKPAGSDGEEHPGSSNEDASAQRNRGAPPPASPDGGSDGPKDYAG